MASSTKRLSDGESGNLVDGEFRLDSLFSFRGFVGFLGFRIVESLQCLWLVCQGVVDRICQRFVVTPRVQGPNNHILSKILTYITTIRKPST